MRNGSFDYGLRPSLRMTENGTGFPNVSVIPRKAKPDVGIRTLRTSNARPYDDRGETIPGGAGHERYLEGLVRIGLCDHAVTY